MIKGNGCIFKVFLSAFFLFGIVSPVFSMPEGKITLQVIDENGNTMSGIEVAVGFDGTKVKAFKGYSDASGLFSASYETAGGVSYAAKKDGYYDSHGKVNLQNIEGNRWVPWNPTVQLTLRKIENPVPMYARDTQMFGLTIPAIGEAIGFDLILYEWLPPYGNGKNADFIFRLDKRYVSEYDFESTLTITLSNKFDGIQLVADSYSNGSYFKLPRFAPDSGYQTKIVRFMKRTPGGKLESDFDDSSNFIFRVRSEVKDKKLIRAMYGKIQGDIKYSPRSSKTASLSFTYYLNPDYTRNLEFDLKQNLFKNLKGLEEVGL